MQTFLPYPDFLLTVQVLDWKRLNKQRLEATQILNALQRGSGGWSRHPAVLMWAGCEGCLMYYRNLCINEWKRRGKNNTMIIYPTGDVIYPSWFGNDEFHAAHRSNLLRKDPEWYGQFGWVEPNNLPYVWPK
jgi:hypothetical protein